MKALKKFSGGLAAALLVLTSANVSASLIPSPPSLSGTSYLLMDYQTGKILVEHNADMRVEPASLTKMMTSYIASLEIEEGNIDLEDKVTVSKNAWASNPKFKGSSLMFIEVGKQVRVDDLMRGIIIQSGNDASVAIAEHISGSEASFADLMNQHAERLGMRGSHFVNSTGLPHEDHYTTAADMARLGHALIHDTPEEYVLYKEREFEYNKIKQFNRNDLLWDRSMNVDGIKTGHTNAAGYCLVTSAVREDMRLISVVMGAPNEQARKEDSKRLLTYGFRHFESVMPNQAGEELMKQRIWMGDQKEVALGVVNDSWVTIPRGQKGQLSASWSMDSSLEAPLKRGTQVGTVSYEIDGETLAEYPLVALETVEAGSWLSRLQDRVVLFIKELLK